MPKGISEKEASIEVIEKEIENVKSKIKEHEFILENEEILQETVNTINEKSKGEK